MASAYGLMTVSGFQGVSSAADWADVTGDGRLDLFVTRTLDSASTVKLARSGFYIADNSTPPRYTDVRAAKGIRSSATLTEPCFGDYNNDGHIDLYITSSGAGQRSFLYVNDGEGGWHDYTYLSGARVLGGLGCAWADHDRDGDLDLLVCTQDGVRLLRNDTAAQHWLQVRCTGGMLERNGRGAFSNAAGIGAKVTLTTGGEQFSRCILSGKGSGCGNELIAHFGLAQRLGRMTITVEWPGGAKLSRPVTALNQRIEIREEVQPEAPPEPPPGAPERQRPGLSR
jgi:hypothetical protein